MDKYNLQKHPPPIYVIRVYFWSDIKYRIKSKFKQI